MAKAKDNSMHWIIGIVLLITGVLIIAALVVTYSQGQTNSNVANIEANVNINNDAPTIDITSALMWQDSSGSDVSLAQGATATGIVGGSINIILNVNVTDPNGYDNNVINVSGRIVRTKDSGTNVNTKSGAAAPFTYDDSVDTTSLPQNGPAACELKSVFNIASATNVGGTWRCYIPMYYLSDPTAAGTNVNTGEDYIAERWNWLVTAYDGSASDYEPATDYYEYNNVLGLTVESLLNLGTTDASGTATTPTSVNVENKGNQVLDIALEVNQTTDDAAWACVTVPGNVALSGYPLVSDIHYAINSGSLVYSSMNPLNLDVSGAGSNETTFDLARGTLVSTASFRKEAFAFATTRPVGAGRCTLSAIVFTAKKGY